MDKLAPHLKDLRERKGLTQSGLGKLVGLDQTHISRLESGTKGVSNEKLRAIAEALGVTVSDLLGDALNIVKREYEPKHPARAILADQNAPHGLRTLAGDKALADALSITPDEWKALRSIKLPESVTKDGYVQLLITIRAIGGSTGR
jgi:transcriptional regulator with XRE-family HTH domain